jgi:propionyl-CoA synthetase
MHRRSLEDREKFWAEAAADIVWSKPYEKVLEKMEEPFYRWFPGGELNVCYNAVDRHVDEGNGSRAALIYDSPVTGQLRTFSYAELQVEVAKLAGVLKTQGVEKGDTVVIYMPMIPEAIFAMLACARLGAPHSVVFGGFPAQELAVRIDDAKPKVVLAASCGVEPSRIVPYKTMLDGALAIAKHQPAHCILKQRPELRAEMGPRDLDWDTVVSAATPCKECVPVGSNDPLYILYTSGTTGNPKGVVRDTAGYAVSLKWSMGAFMNTFPGETYWAASDIGWVVGHSYIVYAPLLQGCATVLYEGKPVGTPDAGAFWRVIQQHKVRGFFVAPTGLRAVRKEDPRLESISKYDISTLRTLFVAGERCDPETSRTFAEALGVPVFDNWWQTETGSPICGFQDDAIGRKDGSTSLPMPGYEICVMGENGQPTSDVDVPGPLAAKLPLPPGTFPTLWNNDAGYVKSYMEAYKGYYSTGDAGVLDADGYVTVLERTDDVINVAAHRISCGSLEASIKEHPDVNDCAAVGTACPVKGQVPVVLVVLMDGVTRTHAEVARDLTEKVREDVGAIATPAAIGVVDQLPKTRSGKVLRKNIRGLADGKPVPVPGTIENPAAVDLVAAKLADLGFPLA